MYIFNDKFKTITLFSIIIIVYWNLLPSLSFRIITIFIVFLIAWLEQRRIKKTYIEFEVENLPDAFIDYRIALATDIHSDRYNKYYFADKTIEILENENYDICLLGGDYISQPEYAQRTFEILGNLNNVYAVLGNHDTSHSLETWQMFAQDNNITLLNNDHRKLEKNGQHINLYGIAEQMDIDEAYVSFSENETNIVLAHQPDKILELDTTKIDLFVCGHTHAGQITFFKLYSPYLPTTMKKQFKYGLINFKKTNMYISSGVGTTFLPFRLFAPAEIAIITLKKKAS